MAYIKCDIKFTEPFFSVHILPPFCPLLMTTQSARKLQLLKKPNDLYNMNAMQLQVKQNRLQIYVQNKYGVY